MGMVSIRLTFTKSPNSYPYPYPTAKPKHKPNSNPNREISTTQIVKASDILTTVMYSNAHTLFSPTG